MEAGDDIALLRLPRRPYLRGGGAVSRRWAAGAAPPVEPRARAGRCPSPSPHRPSAEPPGRAGKRPAPQSSNATKLRAKRLACARSRGLSGQWVGEIATGAPNGSRKGGCETENERRTKVNPPGPEVRVRPSSRCCSTDRSTLRGTPYATRRRLSSATEHRLPSNPQWNHPHLTEFRGKTSPAGGQGGVGRSEQPILRAVGCAEGEE